MRGLKQLSVALIAIGFSVPAFSNDLVCVPSQKGGLKVAIDALYLRQNIVNAKSDSNYDWGTHIQLGYLFPSTANDLTVNYTYFHPRNSGNHEGIDLDSVDLEAGQRLTTGAFDMRMFAGVGYSHLNYTFNDDTLALASKFHGFGPKIGVDTRYQLTNGLGLHTNINTDLVVGTFANRYQNTVKNDGKVSIDAKSESANYLMPHAGAKIGVDYMYPISVRNKSLVGFEVGYQADHYFKAFKNVSTGETSDLSNSGPYVEVKYYA